MAIVSTDITKITLRKMHEDLSTLDFETLMGGFDEKDVSLLKKIYGKNFNELNVIYLNKDETRHLLDLLNFKIPNAAKALKNVNSQSPSLKKKPTLSNKSSEIDLKLGELFQKFLESDVYKEMSRVLDAKEIIIYALRYGIVKERYDSKSIAYLLNMTKENVDNELSRIHKKLGL